MARPRFAVAITGVTAAFALALGVLPVLHGPPAVGAPLYLVASPPPAAALAGPAPAAVRISLDKQALADRQQRARAQRAARIAQMRTRILQVARKQIGDRYRAGRNGPDSFDCSGFTQFVYRTAIGMTLPRTSRQQYAEVVRIPRSKARPGDLVFFFENGAHHVGIYIGGNRMIDAPSAGHRVRVNPIDESWWGRSFTGMGRILPA